METLPYSEVKSFLRWTIVFGLLLSISVVLLGLEGSISPIGVLVGAAYLLISVALFVILLSLDPASNLTRALWVSAALLKFPIIFLFLFLCSLKGIAFIGGVVAGMLTFVPAAIISEALRTR